MAQSREREAYEHYTRAARWCGAAREELRNLPRTGKEQELAEQRHQDAVAEQEDALTLTDLLDLE